MTMYTCYVNGEYKTVKADTEEEAIREAGIEEGDIYDLVETDKSPPANEQDMFRVHLDVVLLRVLPAAVRRDVRNGTLQHLQERLLDAFAGHVPRD